MIAFPAFNCAEKFKWIIMKKVDFYEFDRIFHFRNEKKNEGYATLILKFSMSLDVRKI